MSRGLRGSVHPSESCAIDAIVASVRSEVATHGRAQDQVFLILEGPLETRLVGEQPATAADVAIYLSVASDPEATSRPPVVIVRDLGLGLIATLVVRGLGAIDVCDWLVTPEVASHAA